MRSLPHRPVHRTLRALEQRLVTTAQEDQGALSTAESTRQTAGTKMQHLWVRQ